MALRSLYRRLRGRRSVAKSHWAEALDRTPCASALASSDRVRLRALAGDFLVQKYFEGAAGFEPDERVRAVVAVKACLPVLNLGLEYYRAWSAIVVYPGDFRVHDEYTDDTGVVHREVRELCGQSLTQGPMVLSWQALLEEAELADRDLVIHECAHKLDVLNGRPDGFPPLHADMATATWSSALSAAYERLCADVDAGRDTALDPYAATDAAEFFAVASETFFTAPELVMEDFPDVYRQLALFYRLDPLALARERP